MLKMTIDNEEVVSKNNFTIKEEMLSPSSTILNNTYPKTWEDDKDYISRFYYPKDYAKLNIQNFSITPEEAGTTIQINGSATLTDVDTTKESRVLRLLGQTSQNGTPTPSSPIPVNVVSGDNEINICGKNLFNVATSTAKKYVNKNTGNLGNSDDWSASDFIPVASNTTYRFSGITQSWSNAAGQVFYDENKNYISSVASNIYTFTTPSNAKYVRLSINSETPTSAMLEVGSTATTYEPYIGNTYPIYLGVENLFDKTQATLNKGVNTSNGNLYDDTSQFSSDYIQVENTGVYYTTSGYSSSGNRVYGAQYDSNKNFIGAISTNVGVKTFYISNTNTKFIRLTGMLSEIDSYQLEKGSKANHYTPYGTTPIELCKIGTYQDKIYKGEGYNLFDGETEIGSYSTSTGLPEASTTVRRNINSISVVPNNTYTFSRGGTALSVRVYYYKADNTFISTEAKSNGQFTTPSECYKVNFISDQIVSNYTSLTINEGSTPLPYEPYNAKDKWLLHKEIGKVVLDGSETGWYKTSDTGASVFVISNQFNDRDTTQNASSISNYFKYQFANSEGKFYFGSTTNTAFCMATTYTLETFKTWLASNNVLVYYVLATPTTTEITDTLLLSQLDALESQ